jgi:hypothetical protein
MLGHWCVEPDPDDGAVVPGVGAVVLGVVVAGIVAVDEELVDVDDEPPEAAYAAVPPTRAAEAASPARAVRNRLSIRITSLPRSSLLTAETLEAPSWSGLGPG